MKNVMKQSGKALCYFILYLIGQIIVGFIIQYGIGICAGLEIKKAGLELTQEQVIAYATNYYSQRVGIELAGRAIFTIVFLLVFFAIRKKNVAKEMNLQPAPAKKFAAAALGAIFVIFTVNMSMNFFPQEEVQEFSEASQILYAYPLWQAILANVLLVPILEEIIFRGVTFSRLQKAMPNVVVTVITSIFFGLMHGSQGQFIWVIFAFVVGLLLSYVRIKTGSILPTIMMHVMINGYAVAVNYLHFSFQSIAVAITLYVVGIISLIGCVLLMTKACKEEKENPAKIQVSTVVV